MIRVEFKKPTPSDEFDAWVERCRIAAGKLSCAADVSETLYKESRQLLLPLFHGKCAYCEAAIKLDQHKGDVEHYRPTGGVTDEHDAVIEIDDGSGRRIPHPGYYWLAYDWQNLLPSCIACNRPNLVARGRRVGKWNRFPVRGRHASKPADVAREKPLLLNPWLAEDAPERHLMFDPDTGRLIGTTDRGRMTVDVLDLNREGLPEARRDVYDAVRARARDLFDAEMDGDTTKLARHLDFLVRHRRGEAEYAMAGRYALAEWDAKLRRLRRRLTGTS